MKLYQKQVTIVLSIMIGFVFLLVGLNDQPLSVMIAVGLFIFAWAAIRHPKRIFDKEFFRPTVIKIVFLILIIIYTYYTVLVIYPWGHSPSPLPLILFFPLIEMGLFPWYLLSFSGLLQLVFFIAYTYLISCLLVLIFNKLKKRWIALLIAFLLLLTGIDEPIVNNTINKPDFTCSVDSDCIVKSTVRGWCGSPQCLNKDWDYYDSVINSVAGLSCVRPLMACSCVEGRCAGRDLYGSINISDCDLVDEKEYCLEVIGRNFKPD